MASGYVEDRYYVVRDGKKVRTSYTGKKRYRVRYREFPGGPQKSQSFERKTDASGFLTTTSHSITIGTYVHPGGRRRKFGDYWTTLRAARHDLRDSTIARDESYYRNHIEPTFADRPLGSIDRDLMREWIADIVKKGKAPKTIRQAFNLVNQTLECAVEDRLIATNPAAGMAKKLPRIVAHEMRFLTPADAATLEAEFDERYQLWLSTAVESGLRLGELSALQVSDLELMRRRISVNKTLVEVKGLITVGPPKTAAGKRHVPITPQLAERLTTATAGRRPTDLVFPAPQGGAIRASLFRRRIFQPGCVTAGLGSMDPVNPLDPEGPTHYVGLRIHDLRHTAISWWIAAGADVKQIAVWAGHSSVATVLDRYGHLLPDRNDGIMNALGALRASASATDAGVVELVPKAGA